MILEENYLVVSKELNFTFEEMISLEIKLINKGLLLNSHKLVFDDEGNIRVCHGTKKHQDLICTQEEEGIINSFLELEDTRELFDDEDSQNIQSIPQNLMDTIMTGQEPQASNTTPVWILIIYL